MYDPVGSVIVHVAKSLGRSVTEVRQSPFVLTLWTYLHLDQLEYFARIGRQLDRYDAAGLAANAYHSPARLTELHSSFVRSFTRRSAIKSTSRHARVEELLAAHQKLVPIPADAIA